MRISFDRYIAERTSEYSPRPWLIRRVAEWLADPGPSRFFIISGEPGGGKTAIAARLTLLSRGAAAQTDPPEPAALPKTISAHHFCFAQDAGLIEPVPFSRSISAQLAAAHPEFERALRERPEERGLSITAQQTFYGPVTGEAKAVEATLQTASAYTAFTLEVRQPLMQIYDDGFDQDIFILVDALDEAAKSDATDTILDLVLLTKEFPPRVRFIVTTRPESDILRRLKLLDPERRHLSLGDPSSREESRRDILRYVTAAVARQPQLRARIAPELGEAGLIDRLCDKAEGNFLWTRLVLEMLAGSAEPVTGETLDRLPSKLNELYFEFIERIARRNRDEWRAKHARLLGTLVVAREEMSAAQLAKYSGLDAASVAEVIRDVSQLLDATDGAEPRYSLYHRSMADFLTDVRASQDYYIDPRAAHQRITTVWKTDGGDDYVLRNVSGHLFVQRNEPERLADLYSLASRDWMNRKCTRFGSDASFATDMALVAEAAAGATPRNWLEEIRATSILVTLRSRGASMPAAALALLGRFGEIERMEGYLAVPQEPEVRLRTTISIAEAIVAQHPAAAVRILRTALAEASNGYNATQGRALLAKALALSGRHDEAVTLLAGPANNGAAAIVVVDVARSVAAAKRFDLTDALLQLAVGWREQDVRGVFVDAFIAEQRFDDAIRIAADRDERLEAIAKARLPFSIADAIATLPEGLDYHSESMRARLLIAAVETTPENVADVVAALADREVVDLAVRWLVRDGRRAEARLVAPEHESLEEPASEAAAQEPEPPSLSEDFERAVHNGEIDRAIAIIKSEDGEKLTRDARFKLATSVGATERFADVVAVARDARWQYDRQALLAAAVAGAPGRVVALESVRAAANDFDDLCEAVVIRIALDDVAEIEKVASQSRRHQTILARLLLVLLEQNELARARDVFRSFDGDAKPLSGTVAFGLVAELVRKGWLEELDSLSLSTEAQAFAASLTGNVRDAMIALKKIGDDRPASDVRAWCAIAIARGGDLPAAAALVERARDDFGANRDPRFIAPLATALHAAGGDATAFLRSAMDAIRAGVWVDPRAITDIVVAAIRIEPAVLEPLPEGIRFIDWASVLEQLALDDAVATGVNTGRNLGLTEIAEDSAIQRLIRRAEWRRAIELTAMVRSDWRLRHFLKQIFAAAAHRGELASAVPYAHVPELRSEVETLLDRMAYDDDPFVAAEAATMLHNGSAVARAVRDLCAREEFDLAAKYLRTCDESTRRYEGGTLIAAMAAHQGAAAGLTRAQSLEETSELRDQILVEAARNLLEQKRPVLAAQLVRDVSDGWYRAETIGAIAAQGEIDLAASLTGSMQAWYRGSALSNIARVVAPVDLTRALQFVSQIPITRHRGLAMAGVIVALIEAGQIERALEVAAGRHEHASSADALAEIARALLGAGRSEEAHAMLDRALLVVESVEDDWSRDAALRGFARSAIDLKRFADARMLIDLIAQVSEERSIALIDLAAAQADAGHVADALACADAVLDAAKEHPRVAVLSQARAVAMIASLRGGGALRDLVDAIRTERVNDRDRMLLLLDLTTELKSAVSWRVPKHRLFRSIARFWRRQIGRIRAVRVARLARDLAMTMQGDAAVRSAGWAALALSFTGCKDEARELVRRVAKGIEGWPPSTPHMVAHCDIGRVHVRIGEERRALDCIDVVLSDLANIDRDDPYVYRSLTFAGALLAELDFPMLVVERMFSTVLTIQPRSLSSRFTTTLLDAVHRRPAYARQVGLQTANAGSEAPEEIVADLFQLAAACGALANDAGLLREAEALSRRIPEVERHRFVSVARDLAYRDPETAAQWIPRVMEVVDESVNVDDHVRNRAMAIELLQLTGRVPEAQQQLSLVLADVRNANRMAFFDVCLRAGGTLCSLGDDVILGCIRSLAETEQWWSHRPASNT